MTDRRLPRGTAPAPTVPCRGCGRPLTSPLSVLARYGPRCVRTAAARDGASTAQAVVALVAGHLYRVESGERTALLDGVDPREVAELLAALAAHVLADTPGGHGWLECLGLAAAGGDPNR